MTNLMIVWHYLADYHWIHDEWERMLKYEGCSESNVPDFFILIPVHGRPTHSAAVVVCENGICVWHTLQTSCNWILSGKDRKCEEQSQMVMYCV